jgi:flagellar export protein FliJ
MKKFHFPLDRALDWRRTQARIEESKLERLYAALRTIDARDAAFHDQRAQSETALLSAGGATGQELAALDAFQRHVRAEQARLKQARQECGKQIAAQIEAVTRKRRDVKLIENLKQRRLDGWTAELGREIDRDADEAFLAKWNRG